MENRKQILDYPNYEVSDLGKVYNIATGKEVKSNVSNITGYYNLSLCNKGKVKSFMIHRIVLSAFVENTENKPQVNHINGDKSDNRLCNLEWNTRSENQKHSVKTGLRSAAGIKNSQSKISDSIAIEIFNSKESNDVLSLKYKISVSCISQIRNGWIWTHATGFRHKKLKLATDKA